MAAGAMKSTRFFLGKMIPEKDLTDSRKGALLVAWPRHRITRISSEQLTCA
jgi:hypothetical protein